MSSLAIGQQLQHIFGHAGTQNFNAYSQHIFQQLQRCHTSSMGMHYYKCDDANCHHIHTQYSRTCGMATGIAPIVVV